MSVVLIYFGAESEIQVLLELSYAGLQRDVPDRLWGRKQGGLRSGSRPRTQPSPLEREVYENFKEFIKVQKIN